jgi:hypothetical protein
MGDKRSRKKRASSGARKDRAARGFARRNTTALADTAGYVFLKDQKRNRWPSQDTMDSAHRLANDRKGSAKRKPGNNKPIKPQQQGFTLLDMVIDKGKALETLLTAASLQLKRVRRYPGYVLIHTYNLKNRTIEII